MKCISNKISATASVWSERVSLEKMDVKTKQRMAINFCYRLDRSAALTYDLMRHAYGNGCFHWATVFRWHSAFSEGRVTAALISHSVATVIHEDRPLSRGSLASLLNIPPTSINLILKNELKIKRISSTWVPHMLT